MYTVYTYRYMLEREQLVVLLTMQTVQMVQVRRKEIISKVVKGIETNSFKILLKIKTKDYFLFNRKLSNKQFCEGKNIVRQGYRYTKIALHIFRLLCYTSARQKLI